MYTRVEAWLRLFMYVCVCLSVHGKETAWIGTNGIVSGCQYNGSVSVFFFTSFDFFRFFLRLGFSVAFEQIFNEQKSISFIIINIIFAIFSATKSSPCC